MEVMTERLRLREFQDEDIDRLVEYRGDQRYLEFYFREAYTRDECEDFVRQCLEWSKAIPRKNIQLVITSRQDGILLGNCGVRSGGSQSSHGDVGIELSPAFWGQGYATEATAAIVRVGFDELDLTAIEARYVAANKRSIRLLHTLGFDRATIVPPSPGRGTFKDRILPQHYDFLLSRTRWVEDQTSGSHPQPES